VLPSDADIETDKLWFRQEVAQRTSRKAMYAARGQWVRYVLCVGRAIQVEAFSEVQHHFSDRVYWRLLGHLFYRGFISIGHTCLWRALFLSLRQGREFFARYESERQMWASLPEYIVAYRGQCVGRPQGRYFTLDRRIAEGFAGPALSRILHESTVTEVQTEIFKKADCLYYGGTLQALTLCLGMSDIVAMTAATSPPCCWDALTCTH
jgi:hypothetical protein